MPGKHEFRELFDMVCPEAKTEQRNDVHIHSLQFGYLETAIEATKNPSRTISGIYYLFFSVLAQYGAEATDSTKRMLSTIFS